MTHGSSGSALSLASELREGELLAGRYRLGRKLATGGMGVVFAAEHVGLGEQVAIKFLLPEAGEDSEAAVTRFVREAWAASKIKSEYVVRVSDAGRLESGAPYLVMEYLDGVDLAALLKARGPLAVELAVELMLQACEALAETHARGIYHRDLKPHNLFCVLRSDGVLAIKLLDFGVSKMASPGGTLTRSTALMGTPLYMSPEQMRSAKSADARSDIWALGVMLYELLTGVPPFSADSLPELALKVTTDPAPGLRELRAQLPEELEAAVLRCLEKDPGRRYASVAQLAAALARFGPVRAEAHAERAARILEQTAAAARESSTAHSGAQSAPVPTVVQSSDVRTRAVAATPAADGGSEPPRSRRGPWIAALALVAAGALLVSWLVQGSALSSPVQSARPSAVSPAAPTMPPSAAPARRAVEPAQAAIPMLDAPDTPTEPSAAKPASSAPDSESRPARPARRAAKTRPMARDRELDALGGRL